MAFATGVKAIGIPDVIVHNTGLFLPGSLHAEPDGNLEFLIQKVLIQGYMLMKMMFYTLIRFLLIKARVSGFISMLDIP